MDSIETFISPMESLVTFSGYLTLRINSITILISMRMII